MQEYVFRTGPSHLMPHLDQYLQAAYQSGLLSASHRAPVFTELYERVVQGFREKLNLPEEYRLLFFSSATECWSVIAEGLFQSSSFHLYSGVFGERWYKHTLWQHSNVHGHALEPGAALAELDLTQWPHAGMLCLTHNETSNGTQISDEFLQRVRQQFPQSLIAVDATSSMAGRPCRWETADVWYASVQKCFGLPAGLAVMALSPKAIARAEAVGFEQQYNSILRSLQYEQKRQTTHTPNVLGIHLLANVLENEPAVEKRWPSLKERARNYYKTLEEHSRFAPYVPEPGFRSETVICARGDEADIQRLHEKGREKGLIIGEGYRKVPGHTFRIANFPAIPIEGYTQVNQFIRDFS